MEPESKSRRSAEDKSDHALSRKCREMILERLDPAEVPSDDVVYREIDRVLIRMGKEAFLSLRERERLRKELFDSLRGLDILQPLLEDDTVTEIMVNGPDTVFVERNGELFRYPAGFSNAQRLEGLIHQIAAGVNRVVNESVPIVDARLPGGARVHAVLPPVALDGPVLTIRKFTHHAMTLKELTEKGSLTPEAADFLRKAVEDGENLFISGGTGSGKTTFLNALAREIPPGERVITIEDAAELNLEETENLVRMEARNPNMEGELEISIRDLIRASLRMRPDRIIVGEVRGQEALDMLQSFNTGHRGGISTGHSNSAEDMIYRLETMALMGAGPRMPVEAIRQQIATALDLMVHLERQRDGIRKVMSILRVKGYDEESRHVLLEPVFTRKNEELVRCG